MYKVCAKVNDVEVLVAPLTTAFDVDIPSTLAAISSHTKLLFLCSPGNPTSKVIPNADVEVILQSFKTGIVIVDEAYIDFSGTESACALVNKYPNVVVLQTFSKAFGLAGVRLGMAIGNRDIIQLMNNVKAPYNINKLTIEAAHEALNSLTVYRQNIENILAEREFLLTQLASLPQVKKIHHTDANFILFEIPRAAELYKAMADRGVVCRYRYAIHNLLR
jgi:histidinol-phosphate aminotransferase